MYNLNILFNDYHKFNENIKNHFNILETTTEIDWDDFEKTLKKVSPKRTSIINVHVYNNILLPKNVLEMFNKYNVEVTIQIEDTITDDMLLNYYFKYIVADRLSINFYITGQVTTNQLYYVLHKLWSSYKMYHIYDPNIVFTFASNLNDETIAFLSDCLKRQCDNRKAPIPMGFFEYMLRDMLKEREMPYIPYDIFIDEKDNIVINKKKINIDIDFSRPINKLNDIKEPFKDDSDDKEPKEIKELKEYVDTLNLIYASVIGTYKCDKCIGFSNCQKMNTIFHNAPDSCAKNYEKMWKEFNPHVQYFIDLPNYTINETKGTTGLN